MYNDCKTGKELKAFSEFDCGAITDKSKNATIIFTQAFNPMLVAGQTSKMTEVTIAGKNPVDLNHDIKLVYFCDRTW